MKKSLNPTAAGNSELPKWHTRAVLRLVFGAGLALATTGVFAQSVSDLKVNAKVSTKNWMYDLVALRNYAANARFGDDVVPNIGTIVGGENAAAGDNPFQVALLNAGVENDFNAQFCGGTLIDANTVVTAAHCSDFQNPAQVQVLAGSQSLDGSGTRYNVTSIVSHPKYSGAPGYDYDVAVWTLASDAPGPFATLATSDGSNGTILLATGWGALTEGGAFPVALQKVTVPLASRTDCNDANSYNGAITDRMLCAGEAQGGRDSCQGDSGGPLTLGNTLVGITSWGRGCARPNFFGIYARVSNSEIASFIADND